MNFSKNKKIALLWNGDLQDREFISSRLNRFDIIICADGASDFLKALNRSPDIIIGDLDSMQKEALEYYREKQVEILQFEKEKDFTDSELTIRYLIKHNIHTATVFGVFGDRWDHSVANLGLLYYAINHGVALEFVSRKNRIMCLKPGNYFFEKQDHLYFSVIAVFGSVKNISLSGGKYSLSSYTMNIGETIGISNEYIENIGLTFEEGYPIIIESQKDDSI